MYKSLILLVTIFYYISTVIAEENRPKLTIFYSNGMFNEKKEAKNSKDKLEAKFHNLFPDHEVSYQLAYNQSENIFLQLFEVMEQQGADQWSNFFNWLSGIKIAPEWFQTLMSDLAREVDAAAYLKDTDLQNQVTEYETVLEQGSKILIIAHSQGNFYANAAWDQIYNKTIRIFTMENIPAVGLLSVATPASHVGRQLKTADDQQPITNYITLTNDYIINSLYYLGGEILSPNYTNNHDDPDNKHHSFTLSYLNGDQTGQALIAQAVSITNNLTAVPPYMNLLISNEKNKININESLQFLVFGRTDSEFINITNQVKWSVEGNSTNSSWDDNPQGNASIDQNGLLIPSFSGNDVKIKASYFGYEIEKIIEIEHPLKFVMEWVMEWDKVDENFGQWEGINIGIYTYGLDKHQENWMEDIPYALIGYAPENPGLTATSNYSCTFIIRWYDFPRNFYYQGLCDEHDYYSYYCNTNVSIKIYKNGFLVQEATDLGKNGFESFLIGSISYP